MIASILACPKCNTLIMEDTAICPGCHHVLKKDFAPLVADVIAANQKYDGSQEVACRECQALNREGLVRCWQCGAFMQEEMERIFQEMQARPHSVISSHELSVISPLGTETEEESAFEDDDFELSEDFAMHEATAEELAELPSLPELDEEIEQTAEYEAVPALDDIAESADEELSEQEEDDELLKLAVREERENNRQSAKRKRSGAKGSFLMKGPCGNCKIRVQKYHQGMMGQCPKCALPFMVPIIAQPEKKKKQKADSQTAVPAGPLPEEQLVLSARWNEFPLKKFKPKANMLAGQGETVDLIQRPEGLLIVWPEKKGLLGAQSKQTQKTREEISSHLQGGKPLDKLPGSRHELIPLDMLDKIRLLQPIAPVDSGAEAEKEDAAAEEPTTPQAAEQNDFTAGLELFGAGMIGLEIPALPQASADVQAQAAEAAAAAAAPSAKFAKKPKKEKKPKVVAPVEPPVRCLTLTLSQYRKLHGWLAAWTGKAEFLTLPQLPLDNVKHLWKCVLSELEFESLEQSGLYQADPKFQTTTVGWLCQCGTTAVSETARKEKKFGGSKPAGLDKAKCPNCGENFGQHPLVQLNETPATPPEQETAADTTAQDLSAKTTEQAVTVSDPSAKTAAPESTPEKQPAKKGLKGLFSRKK